MSGREGGRNPWVIGLDGPSTVVWSTEVHFLLISQSSVGQSESFYSETLFRKPAPSCLYVCHLLWYPRILEFSTGSSVGSSEEDEKRREECGKRARVEGLGRFSGARPRGGGRALYSHPIGQSSVMWSHLTAREDGKCSLVWYGGKGNEFVEQLVRLCLTCKCLWARQVTCRSEASRMSIQSMGKEVLVLETICRSEEKGRSSHYSTIAWCHLAKKGLNWLTHMFKRCKKS